MPHNATPRIGWIGLGRMGVPMAECLLKQGHHLLLWNRTRAKAEPLAAKGAVLADRARELAAVDILFTMVAAGKDLEQVWFGPDGVLGTAGGPVPKVFVDCSSIGIDESQALRARLEARGARMMVAPVSGNAKCVKAGKLSTVVSGPAELFPLVEPYLAAFARSGVSYVGEGELARVCKIAHNVMLGVVIQNLCEITVLAEKAGVPRHAFLAFMNASVLGSTFTRYKAPALVNLDWTTTFTPRLLLKDIDLGLGAARDLSVAMPVAAAARQAVQAHCGMASLQADPAAYLEADFAALLETMARFAGLSLASENKSVASGLETPG
jgi:3-hydroxyisobutyrate dehydrogenase